MPRVVIQAWNSEHDAAEPFTTDVIDASLLEIHREIARMREECDFNVFEMHSLDMQCDFCSEPSCVAMFQIKPGGIIGTVFDGFQLVTHLDHSGKWAACKTCRDFIVNRQALMLFERAVEQAIVMHPEMPRVFAETGCMEPHKCFWSGYDGSDPEPIISDAELLA